MTVRNLNALLQPRSVALIGASERPDSLGSLVLRNLQQAQGVSGELSIYAVNPKYTAVAGLPCYRSVKKLPQAPDLAVIVTPPARVPKLVRELAALGSRAAVVISAGFAEGGAQGARLQQAMLDAARPFNFRILGPNCLGLIVPGLGLNASFAHLAPAPGKLALLAQSGAVLTAMIDWAADNGVGFSHLLSLGGMADVDFGDCLNYFAENQQTHAILLYIESISQARKFLSAARVAARIKPVIVLKAGRFAAGAKAAASHTGALAGRDDVYDAAFCRAGLLRVFSIPELFDMAETLAHTPAPRGDRLAIVTNGGGMGVLAADALAEEGVQPAALSDGSLTQLNKVLPPTWSHANPIDLIGDAPAARYAQTLEILQHDDNVDALLVLHCPVATASSLAVAEAVGAQQAASSKPILTSWVGSHSVSTSRALFAHHRIPSYDSPMEAVRAFLQTVRYRRNHELLMQTPPSLPEQFTVASAAVQALIDHALADGRSWLNEREVNALLRAYAIPVIESRQAPDAGSAARYAQQWDGPVALKIASPDISHKSDVGGVVLDLKGPEQVRLAALGMQASIREQRPTARLEGFTVQPMIRWPRATELILGIISDTLFGPVLLFGHGGTAVEVINDKALALPPLNMKLAHEMIAATRVSKLLQGYRDQPPAALDAIALTLIKLAQLACDQAHIAELDINPLLVSARGVLAMDARIRIVPEIVSGAARLAIKPYPKELEQEISLPGGERLLLRPIRAEDEPGLIRGFQRLNPEEIRMRFHHPMKLLNHQLAARLSQIDYDREMALLLSDRDGDQDIRAVARLTADPDRQRAEFAIIVGHTLVRRGAGTLLMRKLIDYARGQGIGELFGTVLADNEAMLGLCRKLGFTIESVEPGLLQATLTFRTHG